MKVNKLFSLMLIIVMLMATPVFAADNGSVSAREKDSVHMGSGTSSTDQITTMSYDREISLAVPKNVDGNQGAVVASFTVSPHNYVNVKAVSLTSKMPKINISISNEYGDDERWFANVREGEVVYMKVRYPNERYVVKVSTNEQADLARLRVYTD
ncbi:hypothetical protein WDD9_000178 [Paenibacillus melissococcoides]|nr:MULTISPECIES: hypothetical protein [Paenibacillus]MEB9896988.1 hypothetical protein [Bacillus cereus]GIO80087.1 hypothetical protein J6TS7_36970 [Paenibacillus dendritiformis]CAH8703500.1 hypothetical protein WDD9_000178 [Paenibacillus melissococcoides]CAH8706412.1 hypothetical protein HTL2_001262 [Paenibacillus melissococcoides]